MNSAPSKEEQQAAESFLSTCPEYQAYLATVEPFEKEAKRVENLEYPLADIAYYEVVSRKIKAMEKMVIRLMNHPGVNENKALVGLCRSLGYEIQHHINEATA